MAHSSLLAGFPPSIQKGMARDMTFTAPDKN